ncbi:MAG TPA: acetyl-CoA carboxylase biotin carboxyl carrier protein [Roseiarcus sp.]|nr:acetyl-CoA carboxylase biotin carboxyl carrier protein [Roseiarcus sp.]
MKKPQGNVSAATGETPEGGLDLSIVAALAKIARQHDLSEVEIEHQGLRVRVARERKAPTLAGFVAPAPVAVAPAPVAQAPAAATTPVAREDNPGVVKSPMVGTAYRRASPEAKPFVEIGSIVKAGDKVMLVEAMKTFNEIVAHRAGKVVEIFVEDATPVEYGQALLAIE